MPRLTDINLIDSIHSEYLLLDIDSTWQLDTVFYEGLEEPYTELTEDELGSSYQATELWINRKSPHVAKEKWRGLIYERGTVFLEGELDVYSLPYDTPYVVVLYLMFDYGSTKFTAEIDTIVDVSLKFFSEEVVRKELFRRSIDIPQRTPLSLADTRKTLKSWNILEPIK